MTSKLMRQTSLKLKISLRVRVCVCVLKCVCLVFSQSNCNVKKLIERFYFSILLCSPFSVLTPFDFLRST